MASSVMLAAVPRAAAGGGIRSARQLRRSGYIPAVLYGHGVANLQLAIEARALGKLLPSISSSTLLSLTVGAGDVRRVLVQEVQQHPLTGAPIHVDFHQVKLTEKIRAHVPLRPVGVSAAVKDAGGVLVQSLAEIEVEALPEDLPSEISFDLATLATFEDRVTVGDLAMPSSVEVNAKPEEVVAVVSPPRTEEELKAELETPTASAPAEVKTEAEVKKTAEEAKKAEEGTAEGNKEKKAEGKKSEAKKEKEERKT